MTPLLPWTGERFVPHLAGNIAYEHLHRYSLAAELAVGKIVLDIASGEGYGSNLLARVAKVVIGIDVDSEAVVHAREAYQADNLSFLNGNCTAIPLHDRSIDLVVSFETLEHHKDHVEMMSEIRRVLQPDGIVLISTPDRRVYSDLPGYANPYHVRELYRDEFEMLLRQFFTGFAVYGQRMCCGSVVAPIDDQTTTLFATYGNPLDGSRHEGGLLDAQYFIGVAWNGMAPPPLPASLFEAHGIPTDLHLRQNGLEREVERLRKERTVWERIAREREAELDQFVTRIEASDEDVAEARLNRLREEVWYWRSLSRIRAAVGTALPAEATVAVVSRGDDRLLDLGVRIAGHFPQDEEGHHPGHHPEDDTAAIAILENVRARGAEYLIVPCYDLWLLDDYPDFGRYLRERFPPLAVADACTIFDLRPTSQGERIADLSVTPTPA